MAALFHFTSKQTSCILLFLKHIDAKRIVALATHRNPAIALRALSIVGSVCSETESEVEVILNAGIIPVLNHCLSGLHGGIELQAKAAWVASNIAYGPVEHVQQLIDGKIMEELCCVVNNTSQYNVRLAFKCRCTDKLHGLSLTRAREGAVCR
eukprot:TRINITY_DN12610_c0_g3_i1.p2 TRINITY_DN12610_c0_g3~~TRINITY_DN12610_c0_g3_i1.p2  ORF type:complete len:153 (+),score=14.87 TRINITY_DN12610_c0_g3_i1:1048-1506(+)